MPKKDYNWVVGGLVLVLSLIALFGGQLLWNKYVVADPINKKFQSITGVEAVTVGQLNEQGKNNENVKIYLKLSKVSNLQYLYNEISNGLKQVDGGKKYDIVIQDTRTLALEQFYYTIHYYIQEAIFTGNFATMAERVNAKAASDNVDAKVYVDTKNLYVTMIQGTAEMYVVISRDSSSRGGK